MIQQLAYWLLVKMERVNRKHSVHGTPAFFETGDFPWTRELIARTPAIRAELLDVLRDVEKLPNFQDLSPDQALLTTDAGWKTFFLRAYGRNSMPNQRRCPRTAEALASIPGCTTAMFSIFAPGKRIPEHRGPYNGVLRLHLGLLVPDADPAACAIRVGGRTRTWAEGDVLLFDDCYPHDAWNLTDRHRVVLFVDFLRPLPRIAHWLNRAMVFLISRTPFVTVALRNHERWEKSFHARLP